MQSETLFHVTAEHYRGYLQARSAYDENGGGEFEGEGEGGRYPAGGMECVPCALCPDTAMRCARISRYRCAPFPLEVECFHVVYLYTGYPEACGAVSMRRAVRCGAVSSYRYLIGPCAGVQVRGLELER